MKLNRILAAILILSSIACTRPGHYHQQLVQADSLIQECPDSALHLLESLPADCLKSQANRAYHALLLTQARDKNYIAQTDDSLIRSAVHYYDTHPDAAMQARAYYLWGSIYRDRNRQAEAVEKYLKAADFAQKADDKALLGRIYSNAGYLYYLQDFYTKADSLYRQVEQMGIQLKDTSLWISSLAMQGKIRLYQNHYPQAEKKLLQALHVSTDFGQNEIKAGIHSALTTLYVRIGKYSKALQHARQNFNLQKDTLHCYRTFLELGDAYYKAGEYDSATLYIRKSLSSSSPATKSEAYMRLADIAKIQGDIELSLDMARLNSAYKDSANLSQQKTGIIKAEQAIEMLHRQTQYEYYLQEYRYYILFLIFIGMASIYLLRKCYLKRLDKQRQKALLKEKEQRQQYSLLKEKTKQKEEQIAALQQKIARHHLDEILKERMQAQLEELNEQHTLLLKKTLQYSEVYAKMKRIISDYQERGNSKESLTEEEWSRFMAETEKSGNLLKLATEHKFDDKEIRYCHLLLAGFSIKERMLILQIACATLYRTEQQIFRKMGIPYQAKELQRVLKGMINGVSVNA